MISIFDLPVPEIRCRKSLRVAAGAAEVWAIVGDLGSLVPGGGLVRQVDVEGIGAGAIRTIHLPGGGSVRELIELYDPVLRRYAYRIIDSGPIDCAQYIGGAEVCPAGADACILTWWAMANPIGYDDSGLRAMIEGNLETAVRSVVVYLRAEE